MSTFALVVELELKPDQKEAFLARARRHREIVLAEEAGCHQAALDAHFETPYMKQYLEDTGPMVAKRVRRLCRLANG